MSKRATPPSFPEYLRAAIEHGGFASPTDFARNAGIHPSVVLRWLSGETRPAVPLLERVARPLGTSLSTLVRIAYPEIDSGMPVSDDGHKLHPLAAELDRLLAEGSKLTDADRDILTRLVDSVLAGYRSRATKRAG